MYLVVPVISYPTASILFWPIFHEATNQIHLRAHLAQIASPQLGTELLYRQSCQLTLLACHQATNQSVFLAIRRKLALLEVVTKLVGVQGFVDTDIQAVVAVVVIHVVGRLDQGRDAVVVVV